MDIKKLISLMTLEEKASMCSGKNVWETQGIERLGIPSITLADGPYGLVKRLSNFSEAIPSPCFPTPSALSSSWDTDLIYKVGKAIGIECQAEDVHILLGPAINIQRSPLGGRNFEYYSEDPVLSGEVGAAFVNGVQSEGVGACVKHYIANNQEYRRRTINNIIEEQALNEIYLYNFKIAIKKGTPAAVMAAYNKINGVPSTENRYLLTDILRNQWNFNGMVLSDWYAVDSIVNSLRSGLDLEMPDSCNINDDEIIEAVLNGTLEESVLNNAVENILSIVFKVTQNQNECATYDKEKHNDLAREAAENSIVLLKNKHNLLPLKKEKLKNKKIAIIGEYAKNPRYQGEGSSYVTPTMLENAYDEINKLAGNSIKVCYARGYNTFNEIIDDNNCLLKEAKKLAKESDIAILFVGTPESYDRENYDRTNINLPENQVKLIREISKVQKNLIVVLSNGSPVIISPWEKYADTILETWLSGQASGGAIANILFGLVNPSGKLSSTFPIQLSDNPTYFDYVDPENNLEYKEGIFVGYRYYDKRNMDVEYPFGFGLSYTTFDYSDLTLNKDVIKNTDTLEVKLKVKNTGKCFGKEIVQLYVRNIISSIPRPEKELKAFAKISLCPDEEKEVSFILNYNDFAYYDVNTDDWVVESGPYEILVGKSSRDINLAKNIFLQSSYMPKTNYTRDTFINDFLINPKFKDIIEPLLEEAVLAATSNEEYPKKCLNHFKYIPISKFSIITKGKFTDEMLTQLLETANK